MTDVVIVSAVRTALGRLRGALKDAQPEELARVVITATVERSGVEPAAVDEVVMGQTRQGCSGARILTTLPHEMRKRGTRHGLVGICIAHGRGMATIVETAGQPGGSPDLTTMKERDR